jgi:Acyltransferase
VGLTARLRAWRPRTPPLPEDLARLVRPGDPGWFARELAVAVAPPWWFWRFALRRLGWTVSLFGRLEVTGGIPEELRRGPLLLATNHIGDFGPFVVAVALHRLGVVPRIMATGGIIDAPVAGPLLERTGGIRVERGTQLARHAVRVTEVALAHAGHVVACPEGRVGLTADGWPGAARARGPAGAARGPADGPGRRRQPGPLPDHRRDPPRPGAAASRGTGAAALRRPEPADHRRRGLPRWRRPGRRAVTAGPRCWTGTASAGTLRP